MRVSNEQLKAFILDSEFVKEKDLNAALEEAEKKETSLSEILIEKKLMQEEDLKKLEAYILGIPFVNLEKENIDPNVLNIIPELVAKKNNIVAFKKNGNELQVAMLDPDDIQTIEFIKKKANLRILPRLTTPDSIKSALKQYQKTLEAEFGEIIKKEAGEIKVVGEASEKAAVGDLKK